MSGGHSIRVAHRHSLGDAATRTRLRLCYGLLAPTDWQKAGNWSILYPRPARSQRKGWLVTNRRRREFSSSGSWGKRPVLIPQIARSLAANVIKLWPEGTFVDFEQGGQ